MFVKHWAHQLHSAIPGEMIMAADLPHVVRPGIWGAIVACCEPGVRRLTAVRPSSVQCVQYVQYTLAVRRSVIDRLFMVWLSISIPLRSRHLDFAVEEVDRR